MKKYIYFSIIVFLSFSITCYSETVYVSQDLQITVRTGPGTDHKIIAMIKSGDSVSVQESGDLWTKIRLSNGKEGYSLTRFLTPNRPCSIELDRLKKIYNDLDEKSKRLENENIHLKSENERLLKDSQLYEQLKKESADYLKLKKEFEKVTSELEEQKGAVSDLENALSTRSIQLRWFLNGAGVFFGGILLGLFFGRSKKNKKSGLFL